MQERIRKKASPRGACIMFVEVRKAAAGGSSRISENELQSHSSSWLREPAAYGRSPGGARQRPFGNER